MIRPNATQPDALDIGVARFGPRYFFALTRLETPTIRSPLTICLARKWPLYFRTTRRFLRANFTITHYWATYQFSLLLPLTDGVGCVSDRLYLGTRAREKEMRSFI
jgi:hypothetical protein